MLKDIPTNTREATPDRINAKLAKTLRVAIYCRVSTEKQKEKEASLKTQKEACVEFCNQRGYQVVYIFVEAWTGTEYRDRPELSRLRELARKKAFDVIVFYAFDRLARRQEHQAVIIEDLENNGVSIECVTEDFDSSSTGQFMRAARAFVAEVENEKRSERTERGRRDRLESGKLLGGGRPRYGYKWNEDRTNYLLDENVIKVDIDGFCWTEIEVIKLCKDLYLHEDWTIRGIAKYLTNKSIPTREGNTIWSPSTVRNILACDYYSGEAALNKRKFYKENGMQKVEYRPPEETYVVRVPAIYDRTTYEAIMRKLALNKECATRNNQHPQETLLRSGYIFCGYCKNRLQAHEDARPVYKAPRYNYICPKRNRGMGECEGCTIASHIIDDVVWARVTIRVRQLSQNISWVDAQIEKLKGRSPIEVDLPSIENRLTKLNKKIANLIAMSEQDLDEETLGNINGQLMQASQEKVKLIDMQRQVGVVQVEWEEVYNTLVEFRQWCIETAGNVESASYDRKRKALEVLGVRVEVFRSDHDPRYTIKMTPPNIVTTLTWR